MLCMTYSVLPRSMAYVTSEFYICYLGVLLMLPGSIMSCFTLEYGILYLGICPKLPRSMTRMLPRSMTYVTSEYVISYLGV